MVTPSAEKVNIIDELFACDTILSEIEKEIILSGYSSGSMCWFAEGYDDCGNDGGKVYLMGKENGFMQETVG